MPRLIIKGTPVNLPDSSASPNWAPGVIEAFEALTEAVNAVTGSFDVAPQALNIDANNSSNNVSALTSTSLNSIDKTATNRSRLLEVRSFLETPGDPRFRLEKYFNEGYE
jgi:hypothetical protein